VLCRCEERDANPTADTPGRFRGGRAPTALTAGGTVLARISVATDHLSVAELDLRCEMLQQPLIIGTDRAQPDKGAHRTAFRQFRTALAVMTSSLLPLQLALYR